MLTVLCGHFLLDKWPLRTVAVPGWKLLRWRLRYYRTVPGGDVLERLGEFVLELRGGLLPA